MPEVSSRTVEAVATVWWSAIFVLLTVLVVMTVTDRPTHPCHEDEVYVTSPYTVDRCIPTDDLPSNLHPEGH